MPYCRCLPPSSLHVLGTFGSPLNSVGGGWSFSRVVATFSHVGGSFHIFMASTGGVLNNPIFSNLGLSATCWVHFVCHHELRPTSVDHPFSFLNSSWGLTGGKHYQEIIIMLLSLYSFLWLFFLLTSSGWFVTAVCGSISVRELVDNNNGPNGHLFYVGGDLMMRKGMLPIIMLPGGDLRIALHLAPFWILTIWGSVHIEEIVVGWRNQLRMKTSAT